MEGYGLRDIWRALPSRSCSSTATTITLFCLCSIQSPQPFHYRDRGAMVTIGRNAAVTHLLGRDLSGFPAWVIWLGVHIFNLIGFRNRLLVLINWAWDYWFYERAVRLILPSETV